MRGWAVRRRLLLRGAGVLLLGRRDRLNGGSWREVGR